MFTIKGKKNDHPGWNHFDRFDNSIVCKLCEICFLGDGDDYVQGDEAELLRHMAEVHQDVDFHWMKMAILGPPKTEAGSVKCQAECGKAKEEAKNNEPAAASAKGATTADIDETIATTNLEENAPTEPPSHNSNEDQPPPAGTAPNLDEHAHSSSAGPPKTPQRPPINPKSRKGPQTAPGTPPNPIYSDFLATCETELDESWTIVNRYRTYEEYYAASTQFKVHYRIGNTICGVTKKTYYCHRRHANGCLYKMTGYLCHDQYGLYEYGKHNHIEEAGSPKLPVSRGTPRLLQSVNWDRFDETVRKTKKCKNGTMTLDDLQRYLPTTCYLKGSYKDPDEMETARKALKVIQAENAFTEISAEWMRILFRCEEAGCSYTVIAFCGGTEFGLFDRGYHNCADEWKTTPKPKRKKRGFPLCNELADTPTIPQKHPRSNDRVPDDPVVASTSGIPANDSIPPPATPTMHDPPEDIPLLPPESSSTSQPANSVLSAVTNPPATPTTSHQHKAPSTPDVATLSTPQTANSVLPDMTNPLAATPTPSDPREALSRPAPATPSTSLPTSLVLADVTNLPEKSAPKPVEATATPNKPHSAPASIDPSVYRIVPNVSTIDAIMDRTTAEGVRSMGFFPTDDQKQFFRCRQAGCEYKMLSKLVNDNWMLSEMGQHNHPPT